MGMDVYGKKPDNEKGKYFRNSVWGWHPLWHYCCEVSPTVAGKVRMAHSNDGDGLGKRDSKALAATLREEVSSGRTAEYAKKYQADLDGLPDEECELCHGKGRRSDKYAMDNCKETTEPHGCNGCKGTGKKRPFATWYSFDVENVAEFAEFLEHCGGFEIC